MRLHTKWKDKDKTRNLKEISGALSASLWRIGGKTILNLENEDYQIDTYHQRLQVMAELMAFFIHIVDRKCHQQLDQPQRTEFITELAMHSAKHYENNMREFTHAEHSDFQKQFVVLLNERMNDYAECEYDGQPDFNMKRLLAVLVSKQLGERHNKWADSQIIDIEIPDALKTLNRIYSSLLPNSQT